MTADTNNKKVSGRADLYARRLANREGIRQWYLRERGQRVIRALAKNGFAALYADSSEEAAGLVLDLIPPGAAIGLGGSMTLREIGVPEVLAARGHTLFDHWKAGLTPEEVMATRRAQLTCDVFLTSVNALTADGQLVCCDGAGNRVSAMTFGPKKVVVVVGANKIVNDLDAAFRRIKDVAAPQALSDIGLEIPCVKVGSCQDCDSPARGCRVTLIMERKPYNTDITVVVVGKALGF
ncbi:MAG: lactate utilization protein [Chloroflexi bacterium]|nr:lactate utilization protein [Chloroflexota bacterium]